MVEQQHLLRFVVVLTLGGKQKDKQIMCKGNRVGQPCFRTTYFQVISSAVQELELIRREKPGSFHKDNQTISTRLQRHFKDQS
jgi:hypothetical protein